MRLAKFNTATIDSAFRRIMKVFARTDVDVQTAFQLLPPGDDAQPLENEDVIIGDTVNDETVVIHGVIQQNQKAGPGEKRIFARNEQGEVVIDIYLRSNGDGEIGGTGDFMVRYNELETAFNELNEKFNALVTAFNSHVHATAAVGPPVAPSPIPNQIPASESDADITTAKIENLKTSANVN